MKTRAKVKILEGFMLPGQGYYREGEEVMLYFGRHQKIGVLTLSRYEALLEQGKIESIEKKEVSDHGEVLT